MKKITLAALAVACAFSTQAFAVDGTSLINQATVLSAGGFPYHITQSGRQQRQDSVDAFFMPV